MDTQALLAELQAAGWTEDGDLWRAPDDSGKLTIEAGPAGPVYRLVWHGPHDEGGDLYTRDAVRLLEVAGVFDVGPLPGDLSAEDVARICTDEARRKDPDAKPVAVATVLSWVEKSKPGGDDRYAHRPVPEPRYAGTRHRARPSWRAYQEEAWRLWFRSRPGRGVGGGRPAKAGRIERVPLDPNRALPPAKQPRFASAQSHGLRKNAHFIWRGIGNRPGSRCWAMIDRVGPSDVVVLYISPGGEERSVQHARTAKFWAETGKEPQQ